MKFLLFCNGSIGNTIMYSPVLFALRKWFPNSQIDVVFNEFGNQLYYTDKHIDKIYLFDRKKDNIKIQINLIRQFRKEKYDLSFHLRSGVRNELLAYLGNVKRRIGYRFKGSLQFLTDKIEKKSNLHAKEIYKNLLKFTFDKIVDSEPNLPDNEDYKDKVYDFLKVKLQSKNYVVIHPFGKTISQKNWHIEMFYKLITKIKIPIFVFGEKNEINGVEFPQKDNLYYMVNQNLGFVSEFIKKATFFIGNDSSLFHIAECHKVRSFVFFQSDKENFTKWKPLKKSSTYYFVDEINSNFVNEITEVINKD